MEEFWSTVGPAFGVVAAVIGWKGALFLVLGMWLGDFAGRRWPNAWSWLRAGAKKAGDEVKDSLKG